MPVGNGKACAAGTGRASSAAAITSGGPESGPSGAAPSSGWLFIGRFATFVEQQEHCPVELVGFDQP